MPVVCVGVCVRKNQNFIDAGHFGGYAADALNAMEGQTGWMDGWQTHLMEQAIWHQSLLMTACIKMFDEQSHTNDFKCMRLR